MNSSPDAETSLTLLMVFCKGGYISPLPVHNLPRLCTLSVDRSNETKCLYKKKKKKKKKKPSSKL